MITTYNEALHFLASAPPFVDKEVQRDDMLRILEYFDYPNKKIKAIHVAGTNGKGSVCAFLNSIMQEEGYNVGLFTSPYLVSFEERIRINNLLISKEDIIYYLMQIEKVSTKLNAQISQFGYITIMMFMYFADMNVDYAIIEVGLGGTYDPTNLCVPVVSVIASISLDHTDMLGNTIKLIAEQKAGIIKKNVDVVTMRQHINAQKVIAAKCEEKNASLNVVKPEDYNSSINGLKVLFDNVWYDSCLLGEYQAENACIAIKTAQLLGVTSDSIFKGIKQASWAGRLQVICKQPIMILDGAHNPDAAIKLVHFVKNNINKQVILVCGMVADKDVDSCVKQFASISQYVYCVDVKSPRNIGKDILLQKFFDRKIEGKSCLSVLDALNEAKVMSQDCYGNDLPIIICGSLYLVGEVLSAMEE